MFRISGAMAEVGHIVGDVLPQLIRQVPRAGLEVSYHGGEFRGLSLKSNTRLKLYNIDGQRFFVVCCWGRDLLYETMYILLYLLLFVILCSYVINTLQST